MVLLNVYLLRIAVAVMNIFKELNSSCLFYSKYRTSMLTAYSSFPGVILLVQLNTYAGDLNS